VHNFQLCWSRLGFFHPYGRSCMNATFCVCAPKVL
jgi:hypothetical protein